MKRKPEVEKIFRGEMLKLRSDYIAYSLTQVETMRSLLQQRKPPRLAAEALVRLIHIAHRLRGSGQIYDLPEVTDWASILESDLRTVEENQGRMTPERWRSILSVLDKLSSILKAEQDRGSKNPASI